MKHEEEPPSYEEIKARKEALGQSYELSDHYHYLRDKLEYGPRKKRKEHMGGLSDAASLIQMVLLPFMMIFAIVAGIFGFATITSQRGGGE